MPKQEILRKIKVKTSGYFYSFFFLLLVSILISAPNCFAYSSCEEACASADESGRNDFPYDGGGEISCCCIDSGSGFESRPLQECENL